MTSLRPAPRALRSLQFLGFSLLACAVAGCGTPRGRPPSVENRQPPQPTLTGEGTWFEGALRSHLTVGAAMRPARPEQGDASGETGAEGRPRRAGPPPGGGMGGPPEGGSRMGAGSNGSRPGGMAGMTIPRQVLQIALTNHSETELTVRPLECTSLLGNFAVRPEKVTLAPGETVTLDAMRGGIGANLDRLEVSLAFSAGGKIEKKVVVVERAQPAAP